MPKYKESEWISSYYPEAFSLVTMKLKRGKNVVGWWTGQNWFSRSLRNDDEVIEWKRKKESSPYASNNDTFISRYGKYMREY